MSTKRERRKWALKMAAALLRSDMECFDLGETAANEAEAERYRNAVREIAVELERKAAKIEQ